MKPRLVRAQWVEAPYGISCWTCVDDKGMGQGRTPWQAYVAWANNSGKTHSPVRAVIHYDAAPEPKRPFWKRWLAL